MKIVSVVGARPNFMKIAPFVHAIERQNRSSETGDPSSGEEGGETIKHVLVHTGQHYDERMSKNFFDALDIPRPDINLGIGSGSHAEQVGQTMIAFEQVVRDHQPDWVIVVGDVNATCACSITAKKEHIKLAHIEAGLRSFDLDMPEEINRMVTDRLSDLLFTTDAMAAANLRGEGVPEDRIKLVGNIMIDTLEAHRNTAVALDVNAIVAANSNTGVSPVPGRGQAGKPGLQSDGYALMTMHRPSNVDDPVILKALIDFLCDEVCKDMPLAWPIHPRTENNLKKFGLWEKVAETANMLLLNPLGYHEMLRLNMDARIMLTDSGGLQEECCVLGTPCLTLRWNTERPVTLKEHGGASVLVGNEIQKIRAAYSQTLQEERSPMRPKLWDGRTAQRCLGAILNAS